MRLFLMLCCVCFVLSSVSISAQNPLIKINDSISVTLFERGQETVNKCTPLDHLKCIYITGSETIEDGLKGEATRHWWRMSYIGQACTKQYGTTFGYIFEGVFAIPHYITMALVNGGAWVGSLFIPSEDRRQRRKQRRLARRNR